MIIRSKTPLRLGLAGGGSDVSPYCDIYGGLVLNATINLYCFCTIEETDDNRITIDAYDADSHETHEVCNRLDVDDNAPLIKGVYNRVIKDFNIEPSAFKITTYNDAPAGSGLGTSSGMVVCILKAFIEWKSLPLGDYELARLAYEIERIDLGFRGGRQDQYAAAFGGFNYMEFLKNDIVIVNPLKVKRWIVDELEASMVLYFTGKSRSSDAIISEQMENTKERKVDTIDAMHKIKQSANDMKTALLRGDVKTLAELLKESWENKKKQSSRISSSMIDNIMKTAFLHGAKAGKISGAGGGGFIMFIVDPVRKKEVIKALSCFEGKTIPFSFTEGGAHGWKIYPTDNV